MKRLALRAGRLFSLSHQCSHFSQQAPNVWIPRVQCHQTADVETWAYVLFGAVGIANGLYSIFHKTYSLSHKARVNSCIKALQDESSPLPPGVSDSPLLLSYVPFLERNQPEIEALFAQDDYHFSILFGDPKTGKTTYLKSLMRDKKNIIFFQFKQGDNAQKSIESRIGIQTKGDQTLPELFKIVGDALWKIKSKRTVKDGIQCMDEPIPIIVVEDGEYLTREEVLYIAKKLLYFFDKRLCSVIMSSNNRTYNYFLDNSRIGGFERFRRYRINPVDGELLRKYLIMYYQLTKVNIDRLYDLCGSSFEDMLLILQYHEEMGYRNFSKAVDIHITTYEDGFRDLFRDRPHLETFILFNIFDQLNEKGMVTRSYDLCFNDKSLMLTLDRLLYDLGREKFLARHSRNDAYLNYYRPILKHVYPRINILPDVTQRRELYETWKIENGYHNLDEKPLACLVLEFKPNVREKVVMESSEWRMVSDPQEKRTEWDIVQPQLKEIDDTEDDDL